MGYATSMSGKIYSFYKQWLRFLKVHCYSLLATWNWSSDLAVQEKLKNSNETKAVSQVFTIGINCYIKRAICVLLHGWEHTVGPIGPCLGVKSYAKKSLFTLDRTM